MGEQIIDTMSIFVAQVKDNNYISFVLSKEDFRKRIFIDKNNDWFKYDSSKIYRYFETKFFDNYIYMQSKGRRTVHYHKAKSNYYSPLLHLAAPLMFYFNSGLNFTSITKKEYENIPK
ncbi:MAG: hypothetical protein EAY69_01330 [Cytophagales bacterium]|nr:MAG: hypothetical protein EAY69_01330 [Cytophagales bacterium]